MPTTLRTRMATVAAATAAMVLAVPGVAGAHTAGDGGSSHHRHHRHHHTLTDAQKTCLAGQGFTLPLARDQIHDPATWMRFVAALRTCGILPARPEPAAVPPAPAPVVHPQAATLPRPSWPSGPDGARSFGASRSWAGLDHHDGFGRDDGRADRGGGGSLGRGGFGH